MTRSGRDLVLFANNGESADALSPLFVFSGAVRDDSLLRRIRAGTYFEDTGKIKVPGFTPTRVATPTAIFTLSNSPAGMI